MSYRLWSLVAGLGLLGSLGGCSMFGGSDTSKPPDNSVDRRYAKTPEEVSRAATESLAELGMQTQGDEHDALGGQVTAIRSTPGKEKVTVWYKSIDPRNTQVWVGVGNGDRHLATMIHDRIAQHMGATSAKSVPMVGASADGEYDQPVAQTLAAAEKAIKDLKMDVSRRETHDTWAVVESRQADALPVTVKMERNEKDKTRVTFTAGTSRSQDTQQVADRLKAEFEKNINTAK